MYILYYIEYEIVFHYCLLLPSDIEYKLVTQHRISQNHVKSISNLLLKIKYCRIISVKYCKIFHRNITI